jgi:hypothetical protein
MEETEYGSAAIAVCHFTIFSHLISAFEERIVNREREVENPPQRLHHLALGLAVAALLPVASSTTSTLTFDIEEQPNIGTIRTTRGVLEEQAVLNVHNPLCSFPDRGISIHLALVSESHLTFYSISRGMVRTEQPGPNDRFPFVLRRQAHLKTGHRLKVVCALILTAHALKYYKSSTNSINFKPSCKDRAASSLSYYICVEYLNSF